MVLRLIYFLLVNFAALGIGGFFTSQGVSSDWYAELNKAPWTPPGWMFGMAWTTIMICFAFYMSFLWPKVTDKIVLIVLFIVQWVLNVCWNPAFFYFHHIQFGLGIIVLLTFIVGYFLVTYWPVLKIKSFLIVPYFIWLLVATSLNGYIAMAN